MKEGKNAWFAFLRDPKRKSKKKEYNKRKSTDQRKIQALEKKLKAAEEASNNNNGGTLGSTDTLDLNKREQRMVASMINGVMNASGHKAQQMQFPLNSHYAVIKSAQRSNASGRASVNSEVTFDHLGNPLLLDCL